VTREPRDAPKAIAAIRSLLRSFPLDADTADGHATEMDEVLESWEPIDRYQLLAVAAAMVRWLAVERGMTEEDLLDAFVDENWPSSGSR
jgi:hypothetical protein